MLVYNVRQISQSFYHTKGNFLISLDSLKLPYLVQRSNKTAWSIKENITFYKIQIEHSQGSNKAATIAGKFLISNTGPLHEYARKFTFPKNMS